MVAGGQASVQVGACTAAEIGNIPERRKGARGQGKLAQKESA